uniref:Uncharacterized protein n=1 Tax=Physcomitrium patens TaxID=3218 RepID=A0A2K1K5W9_PHYPA|nr:hypothetical protein PHYPA_011058 [Physcomitrium patens]
MATAAVGILHWSRKVFIVADLLQLWLHATLVDWPPHMCCELQVLVFNEKEAFPLT